MNRDRTITQIINELDQHGGEFDDLVPAVYDELRVLARSQLRRLRPSEALDTTELVHDAYLKLSDVDPRWQNRRHFFATAAKVMRHILVDAARASSAEKRGGDAAHVPIRDDDAVLQREAETILAIDSALGELAGHIPRLARVVELRFFGGLTDDEIGEVLEQSGRTVRRDWVKARAWLQQRMSTAASKTVGVG